MGDYEFGFRFWGAGSYLDQHLQLRSAGTHTGSDTDNFCDSFLRLGFALLFSPSPGWYILSGSQPYWRNTSFLFKIWRMTNPCKYTVSNSVVELKKYFFRLRLHRAANSELRLRLRIVLLDTLKITFFGLSNRIKNVTIYKPSSAPMIFSIKFLQVSDK
jgi:hypothetical protein